MYQSTGWFLIQYSHCSIQTVRNTLLRVPGTPPAYAGFYNESVHMHAQVYIVLIIPPASPNSPTTVANSVWLGSVCCCTHTSCTHRVADPAMKKEYSLCSSYNSSFYLPRLCTGQLRTAQSQASQQPQYSHTHLKVITLRWEYHALQIKASYNFYILAI